MILIFITNILNEISKMKVEPILNRLIGAGKWSIDLGDCDKVLRVEAERDISADIIALLFLQGFDCRTMQ